MTDSRSWDIFCAVVDNYGDVGVCWRLARQLVHEHGLAVRLWVDDLASLARLCPEVELNRESQACRGVEIRRWDAAAGAARPADVVVEAFACELPAAYVAAMAERTPRPVWINLEYLSAEPWVREFHAASSPHPALPLTKHFFFPGFVEGTGGLLREADFGRGFDADAWWRAHGFASPAADETRISLFGYENAGLPALLDAWAAADTPVTCLLPEGRLLPAATAWAGVDALAAGASAGRGSLRLQVLPFLEQDDYDGLLLACDINFVRGEDSFVRAQWAGKPFVWHIYPQPEGAHWPKLEAFLDLYCDGLEEWAADALRLFWRAWNGQGDVAAGWSAWQRHRSLFARHALDWRSALHGQRDLADALVNFCNYKFM